MASSSSPEQGTDELRASFLSSVVRQYVDKLREEGRSLDESDEIAVRQVFEEMWDRGEVSADPDGGLSLWLDGKRMARRPPQNAAEEPEEGGLRDHVHVGLDVPISVTKEPASGDYPGTAEWWYYVLVTLPIGRVDCVGLVERRKHKDGGFFWAGLAEPGYGAVCWEATQQEAIDALVGYALELSVELIEEMRDEQIV